MFTALDYRPLLRALLLALDRWASQDVTPPESKYPTISSGTLVSYEQEHTGFPRIPGVRYPEVILAPRFLAFGPRWPRERIMDWHPPQVHGKYRVLVPAADVDGNDRGCLLPPEVAVPLATFTGWNLRNREAGAENELVGLVGSYIPFPRAEEERKASGDPRASLGERYESLDDYLAKLKMQAEAMVHAGFLLAEDVDRIVERQQGIAQTLFDK